MERAALKKMVPHGYGKLIAQKAGVNTMTVSQFFSGKNNNISVELATLEILADLSETKARLVARIEGPKQIA